MRILEINYKPVYRKNKRRIRELGTMMFWILLLVFVINFSARHQTINPETGPAFQMPAVWSNTTVKTVAKIPERNPTVHNQRSFK